MKRLLFYSYSWEGIEDNPESFASIYFHHHPVYGEYFKKANFTYKSYSTESFEYLLDIHFRWLSNKYHLETWASEFQLKQNFINQNKNHLSQYFFC